MPQLRQHIRPRSSTCRSVATAAALVSTLVLTACWGGGGGSAAQAKPTAAPVAIPITAEPVTRSDVQQTAALTGSVTATNQISVLPQVSGRVQVPQSRVPPQPSPSMPQWTPSASHVTGVQDGFAQLLGFMGSAPQSIPAAQALQWCW